jgi:pimeloyl-ACP methyl ester carboxylesterase
MRNSTTTDRYGELAGTFVPGAGDGRPPIVLLHGLTFDRSYWEPALDALHVVDPGRCTLALDLPGHGGSPDCFRGYEASIDQVHEAVRAVGLEGPVVVGHSLGAIVASHYAARYPTRAVVNVDQPLETDGFAASLTAMREQLAADFENLWQTVFFPSLHPELLPAEYEALVRSTSVPRPEIAIGYWAPILDGGIAATNALRDASLATIRSNRIAYVFVSGSPIEPGYRAWLAARLPDVTFVEMPNSGHFPHLAHVDDFARVLAKTG